MEDEVIGSNIVKLLKHKDKLNELTAIAETGVNLTDLKELADISKIVGMDRIKKEAQKFLSRSLKIREEIGDKKGIATSLNDLGILYKNQGDYTRAIQYSSKSLKLAKEIGTALELTHAANALFEAYKKNNQSAKALEMHELFIEMRDSIKKQGLKSGNSRVGQRNNRKATRPAQNQVRRDRSNKAVNNTRQTRNNRKATANRNCSMCRICCAMWCIRSTCRSRPC